MLPTVEAEILINPSNIANLQELRERILRETELKERDRAFRSRKGVTMGINEMVRSGMMFLLSMALTFMGVVSPASAAEKISGGHKQVQAVEGMRASLDQRMKVIGIIGGVSWVSSLEYYRLMNEKVRNEFGPLNSAKILMYSIEFGEFSKEERLADKGDWRPLRKTMIDAAQRLKRGGADFIVIASNTMNSTGDLIQEKVKLPVLNIADATGKKVKASGIKTVALLGTSFTMEHPFYRSRLEKHGLKVVTPNTNERDYINRVIFDELCTGKFLRESREQYVRIIDRLVKEEGAEGVILGCTEIPLLVKQQDVNVPVFDTTAIHVEAAVNYALNRK